MHVADKKKKLIKPEFFIIPKHPNIRPLKNTRQKGDGTEKRPLISTLHEHYINASI
jgi:hypothetical protein